MVEETKEFKSEARLTYWESVGIIVGHGIGSGVLAVPYLASRNNWWTVVLILVLALGVNVLLHLLIAELSYNNNGAQFVECFKKVLFKGKLKNIATWIALVLLALSVIMNCAGYMVQGAVILNNWFGLNQTLGILVFYLFIGSVVFFGMKLVGILEKYAIFAMIAVVLVLTVATFTGTIYELPIDYYGMGNVFALYGGVSFALSAVMSVPQVVKGQNGNIKKIRSSITLGIIINILIVGVITFITLFGAGKGINEDGAIVNLSNAIGGWVKYLGYIFSLLAVSTSLWANTLNLRDIVHEQTNLNLKLSWVIASVPSLLLALLLGLSFVKFTRYAAIIQILTNLGIVLAYGVCRHRNKKNSPIVGIFGKIPFQVIVVAMALIATIGSVLEVK